MYIWCTVHYLCVHVRCPKAVENFCVHSRNGYYNGHIFHRVIKQFMIQTGDPTGMYIIPLNCHASGVSLTFLPAISRSHAQATKSHALAQIQCQISPINGQSI